MKPQNARSEAPEDPLAQSMIHLLHRASQCASDVFQLVVRRNLTLRQYTVLCAVAENEGPWQIDLAHITGIDRSTMAEMVRSLVKKGLVRRRRSREDARAYIIALTEQGQRLLKEAEPLAHQVDNKIFSTLSTADRDRFVENLSQIVHAAHGEPLRAGER